MNLIKLSSAINYIIFAISIFAAFVNFTVRAVAYFELAKIKRLNCCFLAFLPILQYLILGKISDDLNLKCGVNSSNAFWLVFFSFGFCVPSAISHFFPNLPFFTFESINSQVYLLNCVLFLFNFFYIFFYIDCLRIVFNDYYRGFRKIILIFSAFFVFVGLDFFASLFLLSLINKRSVSE